MAPDWAGGHDEREQTLNQLLVEMDGFNSNEGVILMAATNRPDVLDKALMRPGRFDRQVVVANPDIKGREEILNIHVTNNSVPVGDDVDVRVVARGTPGFSGADLANLVNEAALLAARRDQEKVMNHDFDEAKDRVMMGPERRSMVISAKEARNTAVHEAGHAIICRLLPDADPVHKVTIIPRGPSLGLTSWLPEEDRHNYSKKYCLAMLRVAMGGRAAEENCIRRIYQRRRWRFADGHLPGSFDGVRMGHERSRTDCIRLQQRSVSRPRLQQRSRLQRRHRIRSRRRRARVARRILQRRPKTWLIKHRDILDAVTDALVERETLSAKELDEIIVDVGGKDLLPDIKPDVEPVQSAAKEEAASETVEEPVTDSDEKPEEDVPPGDVVPGTRLTLLEWT